MWIDFLLLTIDWQIR